MKVEFIYDQDCPNIDDARAELLQAFSIAKKNPKWVEWDRNSDESPDHAKQFGSPTILVDGDDVGGQDPSNSNCCRIYSIGGGRNAGVPSADMIAAALGKSPNTTTRNRIQWKGVMAAIPGAGIALLPKLTCAACWPVYAGIMSSLGIGFFNYSDYLFEITLGALVIALVALGYRAKSRRGYLPLILGLVSSVGILIGKFWLESSFLAYGSIGLLIVASFWNSWPRKSGACSSC